MVGRRSLPLELSMDDSVLYLTSVKETFHDEPAKFKEFLKILADIKAHRIYKDSGIARMTELIKEHPKLLRGLTVFLPKAKRTIPPKASKGLDQFKTIVCIDISPEILDLHFPKYAVSVEEAFADEPAKRKEWHKIIKDCQASRLNEATLIAKLVELMKHHRNLLLGFTPLLRAGVKITIPPEAKPKQYIGSKDPDYDPDLMNKLKKTGKRKKSHVSPPRKKVKLNKRTIHCKKCGHSGHNSRSCDKKAPQACVSQMKASQLQQSTQQVED